MVRKIAQIALGLSLLSQCLGQTLTRPDDPRYIEQIPESEKKALEVVIEDDPNDSMSVMKGDKSPEYKLFSSPLPIPSAKEPKFKINNPVTGKDIWYYEIEIRPFNMQVYPRLKPARLVGYDGISPGPTIIVPRNTESVVRFLNNADRENSVHLHGSPSRAPFDGWAEDLTFPGEYKDYYYPNNQAARMLWYHDHAVHITAENALFGQAGAYIITDEVEDALGLPSGYGKYDIPLVLGAKFYNDDGTLQSSEDEDKSLWGDVIHVNGMPWPFMNVEPRKYRFRFLNAAVSRNFDIYFAKSSSSNTKLPFQVIASDAGLLERPVQASDLIVAVAERYEIVFDFSQYAGQTLIMRNLEDANGVGTDDEYENTDKVMQFKVSDTPVDDPSTVPAQLATVPFPPASSGVDHHFQFHRSNGEWLINGVGFSNVGNRILARPPRGAVEIWELENGSGGWTHPIHVHLVDFRVLERFGGDRAVMPYEAAGLKDVVWLGKGESVLVEAHYAPWTGVYMFHCHNLIHEDQDMMGAFNVTQLQNFGYEEETDFNDPEDPRWAARPYNRADFTARSGPFERSAIEERIQEIARQQPYSELEKVEAALEEAWEDGDGNNKVRKRREVCEHGAGPVPRYRRFTV